MFVLLIDDCNSFTFTDWHAYVGDATIKTGLPCKPISQIVRKQNRIDLSG